MSYPFSNSLLHKWSDNIVTIRIFSCLLFPRVQCGRGQGCYIAVCCPHGRGANVCGGQTTHRNILAPLLRQWRFLRCLVFSLSCICTSICIVSLIPQFARKIRNVTEGRNSPIRTLSPVDMCTHHPVEADS